MKLRNAIARTFGGILNAIRAGCTSGAVLQGVDQRVGLKGAHGKHRPKNPFKGIACSNGSAYGQQYFRHVEGARDTRPSFCTRHRYELLRSVFSGVVKVTPFRDVNEHPAGFTE